MEVDIWLNFGSFLYGLTGKIVALDANSLVFRLNRPADSSTDRNLPLNQALALAKNELKEARAFVDLLQTKSNNLLYTEARVYCSPSEPLKIVKLTTPLCPVADLDDVSNIELVVQNLCPVTPQDSRLWQELTEKIWPLQRE